MAESILANDAGPFSWSLYVRVLVECYCLGAITPFGGMNLLAGWLALAAVGFKDAPRAE